MNTTQAKSISIALFLDRLGYKPEYTYPKSLLYKSPLRNERIASFSVSTTKNLWFDLGTTEGGTLIDLAMSLFSCNVSQALTHIEEVTGNNAYFLSTSNKDFEKPLPKAKKSIKIRKIIPLQNTGYGAYLVAYLKSRCIPLEIAQKYVQNVSIRLNDKHYFMLGWLNNLDGWELKNQYFKTSTQKAFSFIPGAGNQQSMNVFEGMTDFLSALVYFKRDTPTNDTIILNSTALVKSALPFIQCYEVVNLFFDNDYSGRKATKYVQANHLKAIDRLEIYAKSFCPYTLFNDFNDFLCSIP